MRSISFNIRTVLIGTALAVTVSGCRKDLLNPKPVTAISDATAYSTEAKILAQVNGLYNLVSAASFYGGRYLVFNEQRGNEFSQNDGNNSTGANVWNQSISASGDFVNAVWSAGFTAINSANLLIGNLGTSTVLADSTRKKFIAEAKFIRAFSYFTLVQFYARPYAQDNGNSAGLPLRLTGESSGANGNLAFGKVAEIYTQIIKDLDEAETDLPVNNSTALQTASRAHKATAVALKTRVHLTKGDYAKVVTEAGKLVPASAPYQYVSGSLTHKLETNIATVFSGTYTGAEAIFTIPFINAAEAPGNQSALAYNYLTPVLYLNSAGIGANAVFGTASNDARKGLTATNTGGQRLLRKFTKNSSPFTDYIPVIRYAEILLNYAEAAAESNDLTTALNLLKAVRNRSDATYNFTTGVTTKQDIINTILTERRIELLGEGFRATDLLRKVQALPAKTGNAGTAPEILPAAANYVWPVPSNELAYNTLAPR